MSATTARGKDFSQFDRRLILRGRLLVVTGLRVGSGRSDDVSGADIAVVKDAQRRPFVPGSSFKGALRANVERLARTLAGGRGACDPLSSEGRCITSKTMEGWRNRRYEDDAEKAEAISRRVFEESCRVCGVFGSPWLASRVAVEDLQLTQPEFWSERRYEVRAGVGIERDSEAAQSGILYSSQLVPPGTEFGWEIVIENAHPETEEPLVVLGLREMMRGAIPLGGGRSRGMGRVSLNGMKAEEVAREDLLEYLQTGKGREIAWETLEGRIAGCLAGLAKEGEHV